MSSTRDPMVGSKLLSSLRVVDLKEELEKCGLSKSGTKKDLAERLRNYIFQQEQIAAATAPKPVVDDELPNISMQEKLAEKNPFLRDYFASQAELFHSQKVAKKLLQEEEARRESEASAASADEGSAAEDKDLNSSTEEVATGKVKELAKKFENNSTPLPQTREIATPQLSTPLQPIKSTRQRQLENLAKKAELVKPLEQEEQPVLEKSEPKMVQKVTEVKLPKKEEEKQASPASSRSSSRSRSRSSSPAESDDDGRKPSDDANHKDNSSQSEDEAPQNLTVNSNGNVKKLTDHFEGKNEEIMNSSPVKAVEKITEPEVDEDSSRDEKPQSSSSRSSSRSRSRTPSGGPVEQLHEQPQESKETEDLTPAATLKSEQVLDTSSNRNNDNKQEKKFGEPCKPAEESKAEKSKVPLQRTVRVPSARADEMEEEEVLDYGEEEKIQSEPPKFDWTRRVLRLKSKHPVKTEKCKWKRESDPKAMENINSDSMIQWFTEVHLAPAVEFKEEKKSPAPVHEDNDVHFSRTFSIESEEGASAAVKVENITITRRISLVPVAPTQNDEEVDKDLSPARNPPSEVILVSNLTRPFTLPQLRELLQRTGNLEDLWVDKIKSKCIAKYEKQEDAFETRAALHGIKWPQSNPKALHVDYSTQEALEDYKARDAGDIKPLMEKPVVADNLPVREWDMGKRAKSRSPKRRRSRSRSTSRDRKRKRSASPNRRRNSRSPHHDRRSRGDAKEHEPLGKALDELFRKTVATPSIYWLPLTPAQIAEKEEMRRKRMIERERRLAEMNKIRPR